MNPTAQLTDYNYVRDLLDQAEALGRTLKGLASVSLPGGLAAARCSPVILTGMGSSYHALCALQQTLAERGIAALRIETSELVRCQSPLLGEGGLVVAVSQSGESIEILRLLEMAKPTARILGVTNTAGSSLARRSEFALITRAGEEATVSCKTYLSALAALAWLGAALVGEETAPVVASLHQAQTLIGQYLESWQSHVKAWEPFLDGTTHVFLAGRGRSLATAGTGGLILKEAAHFPAEGMSSAALRHGPLEMIHSGSLVCVLAGDEHARDLNRRLADDIARFGGRGAWIGEDADREVFRICPPCEEARPILEMLPVQMLSVALAARAGREPGAFVRLKKVTSTE